VAHNALPSVEYAARELRYMVEIRERIDTFTQFIEEEILKMRPQAVEGVHVSLNVFAKQTCFASQSLSTLIDLRQQLERNWELSKLLVKQADYVSLIETTQHLAAMDRTCEGIEEGILADLEKKKEKARKQEPPAFFKKAFKPAPFSLQEGDSIRVAFE